MPVPVFTAGEVLTASNMNQVGLWLVKSQTIGTAVSQVDVTNCFSADYDHYRVVINVNASSSGNALNMRLGSLTGSNYTTNGYSIQVSTSFTNNISAVATSWRLATTFGTTSATSVSMDIFNPFATLNTYASGSAVGTGFLYNNLHLTNVTTSFTGLSILPGTGTLTGGTISVYGYRK